MDRQLRCENKACKAIAPRLIQSGNLFVCANCVPDEVWRQYPSWKQLKEKAVAQFNTRNKRAAAAKENFAHA